MYGVLGEDNSDTERLKVLIRRLAGNKSLPVEAKGYSGCGDLLRKGANQLMLFAELGCQRFVVCCDADGPDPRERRDEVLSRIVRPAAVERHCIVIPVQELEAWILADLPAVSRVITGWKPSPINNPEHVAGPKERIEKLSRDSKRRPRYHHTTHNQQVAKYLDLNKVHRECPSFRPLADFVRA